MRLRGLGEKTPAMPAEDDPTAELDGRNTGEFETSPDLPRLPDAELQDSIGLGMQEKLANLALAALQVNIDVTRNVRHLVPAIYRHVKFRRNSTFAERMHMSIGDYVAAQGKQIAGRFDAPDSFSCRSLVEVAAEMLKGAEQDEVVEYLRWMVPGTPLAANEVKACWMDIDLNSNYDRLFLNLRSKQIENLVVKALALDGSHEISGTLGPGQTEQSAKIIMDRFLDKYSTLS